MQVTLILWRDIPSQIAVGRGRKQAKVMLDQRFQEAIDRAAMRSKAHDSDAYLEGWRKEPVGEYAGELQVIADAKAAEIEARINDEALEKLVTANGWRDG